MLAEQRDDNLSTHAAARKGSSRPASLLRLLVGTLGVYGSAFPAYLGIALVLFAPAAVAEVAASRLIDRAPDSFLATVCCVAAIGLAALCTLLAGLGTTYAADRHLEGEKAEMPRAIACGLRRTGAALGVLILYLLMDLTAFGMVWGIAYGAKQTLSDNILSHGAVQFVVFLESLAAGLLQYVFLLVAPVVALESSTGWDAIVRSTRLAGWVWKAALGVSVAVGVFCRFFPQKDPAALAKLGAPLATGYMALTMLWLPAAAVFSLLLYRVAVAREGAGEEIAVA